MKVFISSTIYNFEAERAAARKAIATLRYEPLMAEDFGAQPTSPEIACLQGLRSADIVVLVLGASYGSVPPGATLSATHQEYREALNTKPVLAFVQQGVEPDPNQKRFIEEVQAWEGGLFRGGFSDTDDLLAGVTRALHDLALASAVGIVDQAELMAQAAGMIPDYRRNQVSWSMLDLAIVAGPIQRILRPMQMEEAALGEHLEQAALFGENRLFDRTKGSTVALHGSDLVVQQERGASIRLTEQGAMLFRLSIEDTEPKGRAAFAGMVIIEEIVRDALGAALGYAAATFQRIDPTQRITHIGVAAAISGNDFRAWRTRAQQALSNGSMTIASTGNGDTGPITNSIRRAALRLDRSALIEDLLVPLRRRYSAG